MKYTLVVCFTKTFVFADWFFTHPSYEHPSLELLLDCCSRTIMSPRLMSISSVNLIDTDIGENASLILTPLSSIAVELKTEGRF